MAVHPFVSQSVVCCLFSGSLVRKVGQSVGLSVVRSASPLVRFSFGLSSVGLSLCQLSLSLPFCQSAGWLVCRSAVVRRSIGRLAGWLISQRAVGRSVGPSSVCYGSLWACLSVDRSLCRSVHPSVSWSTVVCSVGGAVDQNVGRPVGWWLGWSVIICRSEA